MKKKFEIGAYARVMPTEPTDKQWSMLPSYYGQKDPGIWTYVGGNIYEIYDTDEEAGVVCLNIGGILMWFLDDWLISVGDKEKEDELAAIREEGRRQLNAVNKKRDDIFRKMFSRKK